LEIVNKEELILLGKIGVKEYQKFTNDLTPDSSTPSPSSFGGGELRHWRNQSLFSPIAEFPLSRGEGARGRGG